MILGLSLNAYTYLHVFISLVAIAAGFFVIFAMIGGMTLRVMTKLFFVTTALTSVTGFLFPFKGITPGIVLGILSLIVLGLAIVAQRRIRESSSWRGTYVIASVLALYFNFFVLVAQSFEKIPALHSLAPTQSETPFKVAQLITLLIFVSLATVAFRKFRVAD
ncbi:MAG TPA: hypothetical protein VGI45_12195 [Terracidiphilus sp.]|jgi:hypothetical protein